MFCQAAAYCLAYLWEVEQFAVTGVGYVTHPDPKFSNAKFLVQKQC